MSRNINRRNYAASEPKLFPYKGMELRLSEISKITGIPANTLRYRFKASWPESELYEQPRVRTH